MALLELPHTTGCLVCGRDNPHGLALSLHVDDADGTVHVDFTPRSPHIGFEGIVHGGVLATVLDEAMVWAATWHGRRFCLCGSMNIRFHALANVGDALHVTAKVTNARKGLVETSGEVTRGRQSIAVATGKYVPLNDERHRAAIATFVDESATRATAMRLKHG
jgi:acyl-coenzyme A thioesterase PaaI-like protein